MSNGDVELATLESFRKVSEVNLYGAIRVTKAVLPLIRQAKGDLIWGFQTGMAFLGQISTKCRAANHSALGEYFVFSVLF